ncbi:hypothetical protein LZL87_013509 [Fusarium oxysporum]|nr:hypothetical protein LZL87_013509 [Fusarium oxysporum]
MLRFQLLIVTLLLSALCVQARRCGGGGSDYDGGSSSGGGSSGGGSSGGDSSDSGLSPEEKARDEACRNEVGHTSPVWLHRWVGTYYNGTIELSIELDRCNGTCKESESTVNWELTGVLSILDPMESVAGNRRPLVPRPKNPFIGVLYGWPQDANQSELLAHRDDTFLPPSVNLAMETVSDFHHNEVTFDPNSAKFEWRGPFKAFAGSFGQDSMRKSYTNERNYISEDKAPYVGEFIVRFHGKVDLEHSHEMVVESRRDVSWDKDKEKGNYYNGVIEWLHRRHSYTGVVFMASDWPIPFYLLQDRQVSYLGLSSSDIETRRENEEQEGYNTSTDQSET